MLYRLTIEAQKRIAKSPLSKREIVRRLGTSAAQLYRLLHQTNYRKSVDQLVALLQVLNCDVDLVVRSKTAWRPFQRPDAASKISRARVDGAAQAVRFKRGVDAFDGRTTRLRDARGLRYLARLLSHPRREIRAGCSARLRASVQGAPQPLVTPTLRDRGTAVTPERPRHRDRIRCRGGPSGPKARRSSCDRRAPCDTHEELRTFAADGLDGVSCARRRPGSRAVSRLHAAQRARRAPERYRSRSEGEAHRVEDVVGQERMDLGPTPMPPKRRSAGNRSDR